jgi:hypothetical protein
VNALEPSTEGARRRLYDRARSAMISKLEAAVPPFDCADVAMAKVAFESAVARVDADAVEGLALFRRVAFRWDYCCWPTEFSWIVTSKMNGLRRGSPSGVPTN